jgi:DNA-binding beta-propeller fold protein YncE
VALSGCAPVPGSVAIGQRAGIPIFVAGAVWVPNAGDGTLSIIDARSVSPRRTLTIADATAYQYAGCAFGNGFRISEHSFPTGYFSARACELPTALVAAAGSVWVARNDQAAIERLDARTGESRGVVKIGAQPWAMAALGDIIWITDYFGTQVVRFDTRSGTVTNRVRNIPSGPTGLAVTPGAVFVVSSSEPAVSRIDPDTARIVATRPIGVRPLPVAVAGGHVWVRDEGAGVLRALDPGDLTERGSVPVGSFYGRDGVDAIAFDGEGIWVCSLGLRRVNVRSAEVDRELPVDCVAAIFGPSGLWVIDLTGRLARVAR